AFANPVDRMAARRALAYMDLKPGTKISDIKIDKVFIGSCTNGRIEDMRAAADLVLGKRVAEGVTAIVVPGSGRVRAQAQKEGLYKIFRGGILEWRLEGFHVCLDIKDEK